MPTLKSEKNGYKAVFVAGGKKEDGNYRVTVTKSNTLIFTSAVSFVEVTFDFDNRPSTTKTRGCFNYKWLAELDDAELLLELEAVIEHAEKHIVVISDLDTKFGVSRA